MIRNPAELLTFARKIPGHEPTLVVTAFRVGVLLNVGQLEPQLSEKGTHMWVWLLLAEFAKQNSRSLEQASGFGSR